MFKVNWIVVTIINIILLLISRKNDSKHLLFTVIFFFEHLMKVYLSKLDYFL